MNQILAIDIGGTNLRFACIDTNGNILEKITYSHENQGKKYFFDELMERIHDLGSKWKCSSVGIALPMVMDEKTGVIFDAPNLSFLIGTKISEEFAKLNFPWKVENDANCAVLGEAWRGAGQGVDSFCCLTLGTGVGAGLLLNRKLWKGVRGMASEMGHMKIDSSKAYACACGDYGCLEAFASASALQKKTGLNSLKLYEMACSQDPLALRVFEEMGEALGRGIASVANLLNVERFVLAGQLSQAFKFFYPAALRVAQQSAMKGPGQNIEIVEATLGDNAGLLGAAFLTL